MAAIQEEAGRVLLAREVAFAHAVNNQAKWAVALAEGSRVTFLEVDVITSNGGVPVLGHDAGAEWDMSVVDALERVEHDNSRGLKLDFKSEASLLGALEALKAGWRGGVRFDFRGLLCDALFINADVLPATATCSFFSQPLSPMHTSAALEAHLACVVGTLSSALACVPNAALSLGWCTGEEGGAYSKGQVKCMTDVIASTREAVGAAVPVTLAVRGSWVRGSWATLQPALAADEALTLTVWSNAALPEGEEEWMRCNLPNHTLYDLPPAPAPTLG